jgi:hypothetical protein
MLKSSLLRGTEINVCGVPPSRQFIIKKSSAPLMGTNNSASTLLMGYLTALFVCLFVYRYVHVSIFELFTFYKLFLLYFHFVLESDELMTY